MAAGIATALTGGMLGATALVAPPASATPLCSGTVTTDGSCTVPGTAGSQVVLEITAVGGGGGTLLATGGQGGRGGNGGSVTAQYTLNAGTTLTHVIGQGGSTANYGLFFYTGGGGGGSTAVLLGHRLLVEGGGGGGGNGAGDPGPGTGGDGGQPGGAGGNGAPGEPAPNCLNQGSGYGAAGDGSGGSSGPRCWAVYPGYMWAGGTNGDAAGAPSNGAGGEGGGSDQTGGGPPGGAGYAAGGAGGLPAGAFDDGGAGGGGGYGGGGGGSNVFEAAGGAGGSYSDPTGRRGSPAFAPATTGPGAGAPANTSDSGSPGAVTYRLVTAGPAVAAVSPGSGPTTGNTRITLTGSNFRPGMTVRVGGVSCAPVRVAGPTRATCRTGAHPAASVDVVVAHSGLPFTLPNAYTHTKGRAERPRLTVVARRADKGMTAEKGNRVVRRVRSNAGNTAIRARCEIDGTRSERACTVRIDHGRGRVTIRPACERSMTATVTVVARTPGTRNRTWQRTWRVTRGAPSTCAEHVNR